MIPNRIGTATCKEMLTINLINFIDKGKGNLIKRQAILDPTEKISLISMCFPSHQIKEADQNQDLTKKI